MKIASLAIILACGIPSLAFAGNLTRVSPAKSAAIMTQINAHAASTGNQPSSRWVIKVNKEGRGMAFDPTARKGNEIHGVVEFTVSGRGAKATVSNPTNHYIGFLSALKANKANLDQP